MSDTKALIAEARRMLEERRVSEMSREIITRLAAALEEATPPEGWRVTEYQRVDGVFATAVIGDDGSETWSVYQKDRGWWRHNISTARAAMEALEK